MSGPWGVVAWHARHTAGLCSDRLSARLPDSRLCSAVRIYPWLYIRIQVLYMSNKGTVLTLFSMNSVDFC